MTIKYTDEQRRWIMDEWLMHDASWKCFKVINKYIIGDNILDFGSAPPIMTEMLKIFNPKKKIEGTEDYWWLKSNFLKYETVYTNHVIAHLTDTEQFIKDCFYKALIRNIHIVLLGDVSDTNLETPLLHIFNRNNFRELITTALSPYLYKIVDFGVIEDINISSLYIVIDRDPPILLKKEVKNEKRA